MDLAPDGGAGAMQSWGPPAPPAAPAAGPMNLGRYVSALRRYKWLIIVMTLVGVVGGVAATQFIKPTYQVDTTIVIGESPDPKGPVRPQATLREEAWRELLLSFAILDPVARQSRSRLPLRSQRRFPWAFITVTSARSMSPRSRCDRARRQSTARVPS